MSQLNITQLFQQIFEGDVQNPQKGTLTNPIPSDSSFRKKKTMRELLDEFLLATPGMFMIIFFFGKLHPTHT